MSAANESSREAATLSAEEDSFRRGAKAMFDYMLMRAANHYHGNPTVQKQCDYDNALVKDWAEDALDAVSPDDSAEWRSVTDAYNTGYKLGRRDASNAGSNGPSRDSGEGPR